MAFEYAATVPFTGSAKRALAVAQSTLISQNFQIVTSNEFELLAKGPGISSTRENPLKAVTDASFIIRNSAIEFKGELGGAEKMVKFLRIFPLALGAFFLILWTVLAISVPIFRHWWIFVIAILPLTPWIVLGPLIGRSIQTRTRAAVDALISNMVLLGSAD
jgi:hypothetical protein